MKRKIYYFNRNTAPKVVIDKWLALRIAKKNVAIAFGKKEAQL